MRRSYFLTIVSCLIVSPALSQNEAEPAQLIFDPILIRAELQEPVTDSENKDESEGDVKYIELSALPSRPSPTTTSPNNYNNQEASLSQPDEAALAISFALSVDQYEKSILELELEGGPYEARLGQELLALGNVYQQQGDQQQALEFFGNALHVNRINYGLYDLSQTAIVEAIIESHLVSGNLLTANEQREYLFYLQNKFFDSDSLEFIPALEAFASWNLLAFTLPLGITPTDSPDYPSFSLASDAFDKPTIFQDFLINRLISAHDAYSALSQILLSHYGFNDRRLLETEQRIALINYLFAEHLSANFYEYEISSINTSSMGYRYGSKALERRIEYLKNMEDIPSVELAEAIAELGDWYIIFRKRAAALEYYQQARQILLEIDTPESTVNEILNTPYLSFIPSFIAPRNTRKANNIPKDIALNYRGYIDLELIIDRYGKPAKINFLGKSENTTSRIESQLLSQLRRAQFRPRVVDGQLIKNDQYSLRYYYSY